MVDGLGGRRALAIGAGVAALSTAGVAGFMVWRRRQVEDESKRNGVTVEEVRAEMRDGLTPAQAATQAAALNPRPIVNTALELQYVALMQQAADDSDALAGLADLEGALALVRYAELRGVDLGFSFKKTVKKAAKGAKKGAKAAGRGVKKGAQATGRGVKKGAVATGRGVKRGAEAVAKTAKQGAKIVKKGVTKAASVALDVLPLVRVFLKLAIRLWIAALRAVIRHGGPEVFLIGAGALLAAAAGSTNPRLLLQAQKITRYGAKIVMKKTIDRIGDPKIPVVRQAWKSQKKLLAEQATVATVLTASGNAGLAAAAFSGPFLPAGFTMAKAIELGIRMATSYAIKLAIEEGEADIRRKLREAGMPKAVQDLVLDALKPSTTPIGAVVARARARHRRRSMQLVRGGAP